ncbi:MAG: succinylglutamate desuccinylase [Candidatus Ornithospirochaeta sp.]
MKKIPRHIISAIIILTVAAVLVVYLGTVFRSQNEAEPIYPGPGVTSVCMLSDWYPALKGTNGDTEVYVLDSGVEGASMLVLGGTHPNEPAGFISAVMLIEWCEPAEGVLYVIPRANNSAFTCTDPLEAAPMRFYIETGNGERWFRFGSRATNPVDQWPDSEIYVHASSGQKLSGSEIRNLNRAYPGREDGTFTEKITFGITELIKKENISITVDLHEASPEYTTVNAIVAHEDAIGLANITLWMVEEDMSISIEQSPKNLHGLTHRELGDYTDTLALLMETANPSQGRLHGKIDSDLVVTGRDKFYQRASEYGALTVPYGDGISLTERCARHITCLTQLCEMYDGDDGFISLGWDMPSYGEIMANGIGYYLADPE